uniref:Uncharacterized protein n=1 Tax=Oryza brachyantha TaxID=4533 RepID=J3LDP4_ORYBR
MGLEILPTPTNRPPWGGGSKLPLHSPTQSLLPPYDSIALLELVRIEGGEGGDDDDDDDDEEKKIIIRKSAEESSIGKRRATASPFQVGIL